MSTDNLDQGGATDDEAGFEVVATKLAHGRTELTVRQGDTIRHKDVINLSRDADRRRFRKAVANKLGVDPDDVEEQLLAAMCALEGQEEEVNQEQDAADPPAFGSDSQMLLALAAEADLFHTSDGKAYASVSINDRNETFPLRSPNFRQWLARAFRQAKNRPPSMDTLAQALLALEAQAQFDGPTREVFLRTAEVADPDDPTSPTCYIDLGDPERRAVRVNREGWDVITDPPVRFRRPRGMHPLPVPQAGGSLADLRQLVNVPGKRGWRLFLAWLLQVFRTQGSDPILVISGEQGSAKTAAMRVARLLTDPHEVVDRSLPKDIRDLMIAATNCKVMSFDNVSHLPDWMPDALCRLSTGAAFSTRELYSDAEEVFLKAKRPVIINGIPDLASQADLLDRAILLHLPRIPANARVSEVDYWAIFHERRPALLGALLDCMVGALQLAAGITLDAPPRLADFAIWGEAVCRAAGEPKGAFLKAFRANADRAAEIALESSPVGEAVLLWMRNETPPTWTGEAQELMNLLPVVLDPEYGKGRPRGRNWPQTARGMSGAIRRIAPALRSCGISVKFWRESTHEKRRLIRIQRADYQPSAGANGPSGSQ